MNERNEKGRSNSDEISSSGPSKIKTFDRREQALKLFSKFMVRWLLTAVICAAFVVVLKEYNRKPWMEDGSTHVYNAIVSGLTICLSLNIDASLNAFAAALKWVIVASKQFHPPIFELILGLDSSKFNAIKLMLWRGVRAWWLRLVCVIWLSIVLAAQVGTALIGLTYSVVPLGGDSDDFPRPHGDGRTAIFTQIGYYDEATSVDQEANLTAQRSNAFEYGIGAINSGVDNIYSSEPYSFHTPTYDNVTKTFSNAIANYPSWGSKSLTQWNLIDRLVNNSASCERLHIISINSSSDTTDISFFGYNGTQIFSIPQSLLDYITYISDTSVSCGLRCTQVYALYSTNETAELSVCNSTVQKMTDVDSNLINQTDLTIPDAQARILAGAIGWGDIKIDSSLDETSMPNRFQATGFSNGSYWAQLFLIDDDAANFTIASFTASAIVVMNEYGIRKDFPDLAIPGTASTLNVTWKYSILILSLIPGIQALLALLCVIVVYHRKVPIHDGSLFAITTLLSPALSSFATSSPKTGREVTRTIETDLKYMRETGGSHDGEWVIGMIKRE